MQAKKYLILAIALMLTNVGSLCAQYDPYWQWAKADTVNKAPISSAGSVLAARNGKVLWGRMTAVKHFGQGEPMGNYILTEYDSTGRQLNITLINGKVQLFDAQADAAGNWYVLGRFWDSLVFSSGQQMLRNNPNTNVDADHFMFRLNANSMTLQWLKAVGPFVTVKARAFTLDNTNIYIAADSLDNTVVRRMDLATGNNTSLFRQHGTSNSSSIQRDAQGNFYLAGTCATDGMDFNGATESSSVSDPRTYIVKYRSNGTHIWHYWLRDAYCFPRKLTLHQNRFLFYTGNLKDSFSVGGKHLDSTTGADYVALRLDTNGTVVWARQLGPAGGGMISLNEPYHAVVTPDTGLVLFGQASGYMYWGDSVETDLKGVTAATLFSIGPNNKMRWVRPIYAQYTINQHVASEGTDVWVCGNAFTGSGSVMMDTLSLKMPSNRYIPFMAKTRMIRPIPVNPPAGVGGAAQEDLSVYPVPVRTTIQVEGLRESCQLVLSDMSGRVVRSVRSGAGAGRTLIDVADLPRGAYVLEMRGAETHAVRKIVLQ